MPEAQRNPSELIPYANNAKTHSTEQINLIASSIKEFGFNAPVLIDGQNGIIAGHGRVSAALKLGLDEVPVVELKHLTPAQKKAYILADNRLGEVGTDWNLDLVSVELESILDSGNDISLTGFDDSFLILDEVQGLTDEDAVPEVPEEPVSVLGDIFTLGNHLVMCGDSTSIDEVELLMDGQKADFCFTSPPYNANMTAAQMHSTVPKAGAGGLYVGGYSDNKTSADYVQFNADIITSLSSTAAKDFVCCYNISYNKNSKSEYIDIIAAANKVIPLVETIVWEKAMAVSLQGDNLTRIYEFIFVLCAGKFKINKNRTDCLKNLWKISNIGANHKEHKACFPVALVDEGIKNFCPHGGVIIEPFGGTGTTVISAEKMGCKARLMEVDARYVDVTIQRWQEYTGLEAVDANGVKFNERCSTL